jgi:hypothetical protein
MSGNIHPPVPTFFRFCPPSAPFLQINARLSTAQLDRNPQNTNGAWVTIDFFVLGGDFRASPLVSGGTVSIGTKLDCDNDIERGYGIYQAEHLSQTFPPNSLNSTMEVWLPNILIPSHTDFVEAPHPPLDAAKQQQRTDNIAESLLESGKHSRDWSNRITIGDALHIPETFIYLSVRSRNNDGRLGNAQIVRTSIAPNA